MALLLSQTETGPIGTGVSCLDFADYLEEVSSDQNSWFNLLENFDDGPAGFGINCGDLGLDLLDPDIDEPCYYFSLVEDPGPIDLGINCLVYDVDKVDSEIEVDEYTVFFLVEEYDNGPIGFGIYCSDFDFSSVDDLVDDSMGIFVLPDDVITISNIFLQPHFMLYPVN